VTQKIQKIHKIIQKVIRKIRKIIQKIQKSDTKNRKKIPLVFKFGCVLRIIDEIGLNLAKNELWSIISAVLWSVLLSELRYRVGNIDQKIKKVIQKNTKK
jgi:hypothetical protein